MKALLYKEFKLVCAPITFFFLAFTLMTFIPGYPILVGAFFISMGIFFSFQFAREHNDTLFTALLPIKKSDVVAARYMLVCAIQLMSVVLFTLFTILRMTVLANIAPYSTNALMPANLAFIGYVLLLYSAFNSVFMIGFYKTAYNYGKPFIMFVVVAMLVVGLGEALHYIPGLEFLNALSGKELLYQLPFLFGGMIIYSLVTYFSCKAASKKFVTLDI